MPNFANIPLQSAPSSTVSFSFGFFRSKFDPELNAVVTSAAARARYGQVMLIRYSASILFVLTAFLTGYITLYGMLQTLNGAPWFWWYPIMLGASILLLVGGVHAIAPRVKRIWLIVLAATIPLILCGVFGGLPLRCWLFAIVVASVTWATISLASAFQRAGVTAFIASLILAAPWVTPSVHTLNVYFSPKPPNPDPRALLWMLALWVVIIASIIAGAVLSKSPRPEGLDDARPGGTGIGFWDFIEGYLVNLHWIVITRSDETPRGCRILCVFRKECGF